MRITTRGRVAAFATGLALAGSAALGTPVSATTPATTPGTTAGTTAATAPAGTTAATDAPAGTTAGTEAPAGTTAGTTAGTEVAAPAGPGMKITFTLSDLAVWSDGTPITAADFKCVADAYNNTPGSLTTVGWELITDISEGASPKEVVVTFSEVYAPYKTLFSGLLRADQHADCKDVTADFGSGVYKYGAGPYMMTSWTAEQTVWEKNPNYKGPHNTGPERVVFVPTEDAATNLKSGAVDFVYPQAFTGIDKELEDPNVKWAAEPGGQYEALYFQQAESCTPDETRSCAFKDDDFRKAFMASIDIDGVYKQIYEPFANGTPLLNCGPIAPGDFCNPVFNGTYDPAAAEKMLTDAGWAKDGSGMWAKDGVVPEIHWMVNTGNTRRESTQEFLIPLLAAAGFNVKADNCEALPCVFQTRLPAMKYDLGMYISTVAPDPGYITNTLTCDQIPSEANANAGQNSSGWCNEAATAALHEADRTLDPAKRAELVKSAIQAMKDDAALLPTLQFPNIGAYRTDKIDGTQNNLANYWAFKDWWNFKDLDGDGQVVLGAEQYSAPDCTNPITECSNSSWFQWMTGFPNFPGMWDTTNDGRFEPSEYLAGEPVVEEIPAG